MNAIDKLFQQLRSERRAAFMPFLTAGDPDLAWTRTALPTLAAAGADLMEVGFPFSDPIADGPVIQASYTRALKNGITLDSVFSCIQQVTAAPGWSTPLVAMASYSLIWKKGAEAFLNAALSAGVSGAVVPDLPVEEADELARRCRDRDFKLILLVTPTTSAARAERIVAACSGFVYVVSVVGITGERSAVSASVRELLMRLRTLTDLPLCVGFGVSTPEQAREISSLADGVIVGSALIRRLEGASQRTGREKALGELAATVTDLRKALDPRFTPAPIQDP
jgi:tryptophan synthase alpha chain